MTSKLLACAFAFAAAQAAWGQASVTGSFTVNGNVTKIGGATVLQTKDWILGPDKKFVEAVVIKLGLSNSPIEDIEDDFELGVRGKEGTLHGIRIELSKKGNLMSGNVYDAAWEGGTASIFTSHVLFEPKVFTDQSIAGRIRMDGPAELNGVKFDFDITFTAPVLSEPKPTAEGTAAAGTEPAKAVTVFLHALSSKDVPALKSILRKEFVEMLEKPGGEDAVFGMLGWAYPAEAMKQLKIVRVFDFGKRAWVEGMSKRKSEHGGPPTDVTYRIRTVRVGSDWKVQPM